VENSKAADIRNPRLVEAHIAELVGTFKNKNVNLRRRHARDVADPILWFWMRDCDTQYR
jgi:hypothetical protein